jgi:hypothetical protein
MSHIHTSLSAESLVSRVLLEYDTDDGTKLVGTFLAALVELSKMSKEVYSLGGDGSTVGNRCEIIAWIVTVSDRSSVVLILIQFLELMTDSSLLAWGISVLFSNMDEIRHAPKLEIDL